MLIPIDAIVAGVFYTLAAAAIAGAIALIVAKKIFHSALFLTLTLGSVAGTYVILGADFLAAVQVLVYVGAIMVLIIFGIMLTPQNVELPDIGGTGQAMAGTIVSVAIFVAAAGVLITSAWPRSSATPIDVPTTQTIGVGLLTTHALPFEIASVLLLLAMIGAIVIARED